jgi:O-antigen/teichoic acid export membrane protein
MNLFNRLLVNALYIYGGKIFEGILQLGVLAFILSRMEREYYAAALLIISIQSTIDLARGGIQKATLKYIAEFKSKGNDSGVSGVLSSSTAIQGAVGLLGLSACLIIAPFSTTLFSLPNYMHHEAQWATILLGMGIALAFAITPWHNAVAALERYDLLSVATVCGKLFRAVLIVIFLLSDVPALISLVLAIVAGGIAERLICIFFVKKISHDLKFGVKNVSFAYIKVMLSFSLFDFFHTLSSFLYSQGGLYFAAHLISLDAVAAIGIIDNIASLIGLLTNQIAQMLVPVASRLNAQGDQKKLRDLVARGTTITVFAGGIVMVGIIPWVQSLLVVWLGSAYANLTVPAIVLITAQFLVSSLTCIHNSLGGIGRVAVDGISNTLCTIMGLSIGVGLVYWADLAFMGLVIGLLCVRVFRFLFVNWYGGMLFGFPMAKYLWRGYLRTYLLVLAISFTGLHTGLSFASWISLLTAGCISAGLYFAAGAFWIIDVTDRSRFIQALIDGVTYFRVKMQGQKI